MTDAASIFAAAIERYGSEAALGRAVGRSQNAIWAAKRSGRVSADLAKRIHDATAGEFPKWGLRPDLWDEPLIAANSAAAQPEPARAG